MDEGAEDHHGEIPSRHPLAALSFGAILAFVGGRVRRGARVAKRSATPVAEQEPVVADRTGIVSLLMADDPDRHGGLPPGQAADGGDPAGLCQDHLWQPDQPRPGAGAFGAGALIGSLLFGAVGRHWPRRLTFLTCWVLGPLVIFGTLAATPPLPVLVAVGLVGGLLFGPINPLASTVIQEHTPPHMLGRVFGVLTALAQAGIPIGAVLAGVVVQRAGLVPTILGMGAICLLVTLGVFFNRSLHQMEAAEQR